MAICLRPMEGWKRFALQVHIRWERDPANQPGDVKRKPNKRESNKEHKTKSKSEKENSRVIKQRWKGGIEQLKNRKKRIEKGSGKVSYTCTRLGAVITKIKWSKEG
ncbi:hypothetical protein TRVL_10344 [Trypanosoma vivax]|nr:hypothetical protein TRVL_10344 [Trypanosoma vivax]